MTKTEPFGMEEKTIQTFDLLSDFQIRHGFVATRVIKLVADDRMFDESEMHANLMRPPGFDFDVKERKTLESLSDFP